MSEIEEAERLAREFTIKANVCTYAGVFNLAVPVFLELVRLRRGKIPIRYMSSKKARKAGQWAINKYSAVFKRLSKS